MKVNKIDVEVDVDAETDRLYNSACEHMQMLPLDVLVAAANEIIDLNAIAVNELRARGLDEVGRWVGFDKA
jgi:predicted DNA-binding helix-hairpin-helix protein